MQYDVLIIGAGAAGLMCAIEAGKRGRKVLLLDHAKKIAEKIRISGGGRCNFTNLHATPENYISSNPKFCISALRRFTQHDFIALVEKYKIAWHEKTLGQLFCNGSSQEIIDMLLAECHAANVCIKTETSISNISKDSNIFTVEASIGTFTASSLVIATGGPSIPKMGSSGFGYKIAEEFGLKIVPPRAGLVPFTFFGDMLEYCKSLAGIALECTVSCNKKQFREAMLLTHRGLSGPAILQISSYWQEGGAVEINLLPGLNLAEILQEKKSLAPKQQLQTILAELLPKRLAEALAAEFGFKGNLADLSSKNIEQICARIHRWNIIPDGTEGYRTAEVTIGGVDTNELSSQTFESKKIPGLYFIGEVVDVTGWLGGYNFQWAWASGWCTGQVA